MLNEDVLESHSNSSRFPSSKCLNMIWPNSIDNSAESSKRIAATTSNPDRRKERAVMETNTLVNAVCGRTNDCR